MLALTYYETKFWRKRFPNITNCYVHPDLVPNGSAVLINKRKLCNIIAIATFSHFSLLLLGAWVSVAARSRWG
jgi:hypothetical protein